MQTRTLGSNGPTVSALGLGAMGMSDFYGPADRAESLATLHEAMDAGITLIDTADFYGSGHNEMLIAEAVGDRRDRAFIQVKFGVLRDPAGGFIGGAYRPQDIKNALAYTLKRLNTDYVDLYQPARIPADVPIEDIVGTIDELKQQGYVRHIGLSEASAATIRKANATARITAIQMEYSLVSRSIEGDILDTCRELDIGVTAYGALSRGLLSGSVTKDTYTGKRDFRAMAPRFQADNLVRNLELVEQLRSIAMSKGISTAQLAIAWVLHRGDRIIPMIGARKRTHLDEAIGAVDVNLTEEDSRTIEAAVPESDVAGERYDEHGMAMLDSERR